VDATSGKSEKKIPFALVHFFCLLLLMPAVKIVVLLWWAGVEPSS
jgi:hypothetical protein